MAEKKNENIINSAKGLMDLPITRQILLLGMLALSIALGYSVVSWLYETNYRPLFSELDSKSMGAISDYLQKNGIDFKISDRDGAILVPVSKYKEAKLKLASAGFNENNTFGYDDLEKTNGFGSSRFIENIRYTRALEGELARTIMSIQGIRAARVHLALPKPTVFVGDNQIPTASVLLELIPGHKLDASQVNGIMQLVAGSVSGMKANDVTVTDQHGKLLSEKNNTELALSEEQLNYQKEIQNYYEKRIQTMITPLVGIDRVQVRVFANLDFTHTEKTEEQFNPKDKIIRSEQTSTEQGSGASGGGTPGSLTNQPPESGGTTAGSSGGGSSSRSQSLKNYEISKTISYSRTGMGRLINLSVAVVVDNEKIKDPKTQKELSQALPAEKIEKINQLVKAAIGFDDKRGDKVSVINTAFAPPLSIGVPPEPAFYKQGWFWDMMEKIGAVFLTILVGLGVIRPILKSLARGTSGSAIEKDEKGERIFLTPEMQRMKQQQLESLKQLANQEPTKVAGIIKNWVEKKE